MQAVAQIAHAQEQRQRRHAPADAVHESGRAGADFRRNPEALERQRYRAEKREHGQPQRQRQPHCLTEQRPDLVPPPAAVQLRHRGGHRDQRPHRHQQWHPEQRCPYRHSGERGGAVPSGDERIHQTDQAGRDVPGHQRRGELRAAAQFIAETRSRRCGLSILIGHHYAAEKKSAHGAGARAGILTASTAASRGAHDRTPSNRP